MQDGVAGFHDVGRAPALLLVPRETQKPSRPRNRRRGVAVASPRREDEAALGRRVGAEPPPPSRGLEQRAENEGSRGSWGEGEREQAELEGGSVEGLHLWLGYRVLQSGWLERRTIG